MTLEITSQYYLLILPPNETQAKPASVHLDVHFSEPIKWISLNREAFIYKTESREENFIYCFHGTIRGEIIVRSKVNKTDEKFFPHDLWLSRGALPPAPLCRKFSQWTSLHGNFFNHIFWWNWHVHLPIKMEARRTQSLERNCWRTELWNVTWNWSIPSSVK